MEPSRLVRARPTILSVAKLLTIAIAQLPLVRAAPFRRDFIRTAVGPDAQDPTLWIYLAVAVTLVLLGGVFAGLTIALMGQDDVNLQVIHASGEGTEKKHAGKVLGLLKRGKHWVLVTLLLGNVITNETLPIVLDRSLGGGWPAVLGSTVLIVIFGEIIPQSICVRYGLPIGAWMSPLVLVLMYILAPAAWPTAKLLDYLLGEDHGTVYKKAGLKTLVGLHKTLGTSPHERLNEDEVTIISAVLDLKDKSVGDIMTPMDDVFTMSEDAVLDEKTMDTILSQGYSRIPIHGKDNEENFVGMLLVKILITYDPEDCKRVGDFALATLPETKPDASCLDIVNYFQEGKSHMVLVSDSPGEDYGALGVVTLEDVIEELIGEEIIDESDVFVDVHKAIRRMTPAAQQSRMPFKRQSLTTDKDNAKAIIQTDPTEEDLDDENAKESFNEVAYANGEQIQTQAESKAEAKAKASALELGTSPKTKFLVRRSSSLVNTSNDAGGNQPVMVRGNGSELREHLRHLGPSNLASRPKQTRYNTVKIKQGTGISGAGLSGAPAPATAAEEPVRPSLKANLLPEQTRSQSFALAKPAPQGGIGAGLLNSAGKDARGGVQALKAGYGTMERPSGASPPSQEQKSPTKTTKTSPTAMTSKGVQANTSSDLPQTSPEADRLGVPERHFRSKSGGSRRSRRDDKDDGETSPHSTLGSLHSGSPSPFRSRGTRSGSITENVVETGGGVRKVILETTSSSTSVSEDGGGSTPVAGGGGSGAGAGGVEIGKARDGVDDREDRDTVGSSTAGSEAGGKKKRRRRRKKGGSAGGDRGDGEDAPLLEEEEH